MYSFNNIFYHIKSKKYNNIPENIIFGKWTNKLDILDYKYDNIISRLIRYIKDLGEDPYNRKINVEMIIDFSIKNNITSNSIDFIYRHYVYNLMSQVQDVDINKEELLNLEREFYVIDSEI